MYRRRYRRIIYFFARHLTTLILWDIIFPRIGLREYSQRSRTDRLRNLAISFRELAIELGGLMIKVGQFLSTRVDVMPPEFTKELAGLQDEVPAASFDGIKHVVESEFNAPIEHTFISFEAKPLAAASLGQVHLAKIYKPVGTNSTKGFIDHSENLSKEVINVVVKVQRPNIEEIVKTDLSALKTVGSWLDRYPPIRRRADIPALIKEFSRIVFEEIDYLAEGRNAEVFAEQFKTDPKVRVPKVLWQYTTKRVLTLENVFGIKITDYDAIDASGVDRHEVASYLIETYFKQIFVEGFFHADPHPGNLFVNPIPLMPPLTNLFSDAENRSEVFWQLTFVDFGMVGRIPDKTRHGLRELLIGVGTRDTRRVMKAYQDLDIILPGADLTKIEKAGTEIFDRFWGKNMTELSQISTEEIMELSREYRDLIYELPFQIPQNIIFLGRTVSILSGICTGLDPEFNIFDHMAPYAQTLILEESRIKPAEILSDLGVFARTLFTLPRRVNETIDKLEKGDIAVRMPEVTQRVKELEKGLRQIVWGIIFTAFLLSGVQAQIGNEELISYLLFSGAFLSIIMMFFSGRRNRNR
jgi:predicted unusual protein kinase regulating ubiquinone biosynthesis (AarF/ABC1/UbiB family)